MKRKLIKNLCLVSFLAAIVMLSSCANPNGLHNQTAAKVTFVFKNFGTISGDYTME